ncbi:unnamed protein product [Euphydryas editha]|uniref:Uncharacterized protein n=1 Tax=Euphydryas editha TaxID=104508 RepID=A0AAU9TFV4_EUPED|nr:unnamed protein product [Euphydryas editha]
MEKECVSRWGWWQTRIAALLALPVLLTGMYGTNYVFLAARTPHSDIDRLVVWCQLNHMEINTIRMLSYEVSKEN